MLVNCFRFLCLAFLAGLGPEFFKHETFALSFPALPKQNATLTIPGQEWPLHPGPREFTAYVYYPRGSLAYTTSQTGLMLSLHNWGGTKSIGTADPQQLADRYNLIAICVDYLQSGQEPLRIPEPYDFGYLQALDALRALHCIYHGLQEIRHSFDSGRIYCTGGSGGGNVTLMVNKFAPRTFACCIDICGMNRLTDDVAFHLPGGSPLNAKYSRDPRHASFLSPDAQLIRDAGYPPHLQLLKKLGNSARVIVVHGVDDEACPAAEAKLFISRMQEAQLNVAPRLITQADVDGDVYFSTGHNLGDRTKIVFREAERYLSPASPNLLRRREKNDFDLHDELVRFETPGGRFIISYLKGYPVSRFEPR